jgi:nucleotide-binding universal stress UspA family protein
MSDTLLVGIDGSAASHRAAAFAVGRARLSAGARVVLACVIEWSPFTIYTHEELETRHRDREAEIEWARTQVLEPLLGSLRRDGVELETVVRHGHASRVLIDLSQELGACQIFVGRLGQTTLLERLFGSTVTNLVQVSPVPVTVVP